MTHKARQQLVFQLEGIIDQIVTARGIVALAAANGDDPKIDYAQTEYDLTEAKAQINAAIINLTD